MKDNTLKWIFSVIGREKLKLAILTIVKGVYGTTGVLYALLLKKFVNFCADGNREGFWKCLIALIGLVGFQILLRSVIRWLTELSKISLENVFKLRLTSVLLHKDYLRIRSIHSGEWLNRLTNDAMVVAEQCTGIVPGLTEMMIKLISVLAMIMALEPRFSFILFPGFLLVVAFSWGFRKLLKKLHKEVQEADGRLRAFLQEHIANMLIIRSFAVEKQTELQTMEKMRSYQIARMHKNSVSNICNTGFGIAMNGLYLLSAGWCGYGIMRGEISFGTLLAIMHLVAQIQAPIVSIPGYLPKYYAMLASAERLMEAEALEEQQEHPMSMENIKKLDWAGIGLRNISFAYYPTAMKFDEIRKDNMPAVIDNLTLLIRRNECIAITGHSGCGKTTILKLLMGIYHQDSGQRFYWDSRRQEYPLSFGHRRLFAYVPQSNMLMSGTIREIISFADPQAENDEKRLTRALRIACADGFVNELEAGIDTLLGEHGVGLSEGQMQRLAIARALFSEAPILLFDESTSALDIETEKRVLENIRNLIDKTVVIVTHHKSVLEICNRVINIT